MYPISIKILEKTKMNIEWSDKSISSIPLTTLRKYCPCAVCSADREKQSKYYIPLLYGEQIKIVKINSVGNYAIEIVWADGHNTGIYEYPFLKKLSESTSG